MSERTLKQLVGALVVVVVLWGVTALLSGGSGGAREAAGGLASFFEEMRPETVTSVNFSGPAGEIALTRDGDRWLVNGMRTDSGTVSRFWAAVASFSIGDLAAANPANHDRMGVSKDSAWTFTVEMGSGSRTLLIGGQGPRFATSYVRLPDADEVYVLEGDLRVHVRRQLNEWRDKHMVRVDTSAVSRVEVLRDGDRYALVRGDSIWTVEGGGEADAASVRNLLSELADLQASGFLADGDSLAVLPEGGSIQAFDSGGAVLAEIRLGSGEGDRWARTAGDDVLYKLPSWRIDRVAPEPEKLEGA
jgi:Domain of unknown function (DUF4340)